MSSKDIAVSVRGLSKAYTIAHNAPKHTMVGEALVHRLKNPFQRVEKETFWALKDVEFDIQKGEVVGIIGRNGAGKSTLLKILSRITKPTKGQIDLYGRVGALLEVGTGFHPELTGRENIFLNGAILGMRKREIERQFDAIVDFAGVEKFLDTPVKRYSSGMYVRLAFAVAAHLNPEILIVDEVLAVGDAEFQKKCLGKMQDVAQSGRTVLFVSHNMGAVRGLCGSAIWLNGGRISRQGPTLEIVSDYLEAGLEKRNPSFEVRDVMRSSDSGERLLITKIEFNEGETILHGEPLTISIEYEAFTELYGVAFGIGISSLEGTRLMSLDSDLLESRQDFPGAQTGRVEIRLNELYLPPGNYTLDIAARSGDHGGLDYLPGCAQIEVLPGPTTPSVIIRDGGGLRIPAHWKWKSNVNAHAGREFN